MKNRLCFENVFTIAIGLILKIRKYFVEHSLISFLFTVAPLNGINQLMESDLSKKKKSQITLSYIMYVEEYLNLFVFVLK
jgi:hypothetical protein